MSDLKPETSGFRSGYVALCGRPNVGKSTLLNALLGEPLAITCRRPQTTRENMLGIWTTDQFQAVLVDTPGLHRAKSALNRHMVEEAEHTLRSADLVLMLAELPILNSPRQLEEWEPGPGALDALNVIRASQKPVALGLTKLDRIDEQASKWASQVVPTILERWRAHFDFVAEIPMSAPQGAGLDTIKQLIAAHLPEGEALFDPEQLTDREMRWHAAEWIRLELMEKLGDEIPYSAAVVVREYRELREYDRIEATIHVERDSQKGIVIGRGGQVVREISMAARARIAALTGRRCDLYLDVKVTRNWTRDPDKLGALGYISRSPSTDSKRK